MLNFTSFLVFAIIICGNEGSLESRRRQIMQLPNYLGKIICDQFPEVPCPPPTRPTRAPEPIDPDDLIHFCLSSVLDTNTIRPDELILEVVNRLGKDERERVDNCILEALGRVDGKTFLAELRENIQRMGVATIVGFGDIVQSI